MTPKGLCEMEENICFEGAAELAVCFQGLFFTNTLAKKIQPNWAGGGL